MASVVMASRHDPGRPPTTRRTCPDAADSESVCARSPAGWDDAATTLDGARRSPERLQKLRDEHGDRTAAPANAQACAPPRISATVLSMALHLRSQELSLRDIAARLNFTKGRRRDSTRLPRRS